jgi:ketosteroid isomerase-like protein
MKTVDTVSRDTLREIGDAFKRHDVDGVMAFFAADAVFGTPNCQISAIGDSSEESRYERESPPASPVFQTSTKAKTRTG